MMRWRNTIWSKLAACGGLAALAANAAMPVVLAFLLAAAIAPDQHRWVQIGDGAWRFDAPLCHHDDAGRGAPQHGKSHGAPCPVCSLHGAVAIALPLPTARAPDPVAVAATAEIPITASEPAVFFAAGYRSRAPPIV
jgi:hypothetical protein